MPLTSHLRPRLTVLCVSLLIVPAIWNLAAVKWLHFRNPPPGQFFEVRGLRMHIDCLGQGSPTVILEAGAGAPWSVWRKVQPELAKITRVCSYDRAGHGWSDPRPRPRDADTIARELHDLLSRAGVKPPFILVGHSAGGLYVRNYTRQFPSGIVAVGLLESSSPEQIDELPGFRDSYEQDKRDEFRQLWIDRMRVWSGWERLIGNCSNSPAEYGSWTAQYNAMACRPGWVDTDECELRDFEQSCRQAGLLKSFGNIPLLVMSRDPKVRRSGMTAREIAGMGVWDREQERLKSLSSRSWRVTVRGAGHMLPRQNPAEVNSELARLIGCARGRAFP